MFKGKNAKRLLGVIALFLFLLIAGGVMTLFAEHAPDMARIVWRVIIGGGVLLLFMVWDLWSNDEPVEEDAARE